MAEEKKNCCGSKKWKGANTGSGGGAVWCLGFVGALVYYIQNASSFWEGVLGIIKAIVWPAMMVYHLFSFLGL